MPKNRRQNTGIFNVLKKSLGSQMLKETFRRSKKDFTRERKMPFKKVVLFMMNLSRRSLQIEITSFIRSFADGVHDVTSSAFNQNRKKIDPLLFRELLQVLNREFYTDNEERVLLWEGMRLLATDGSILNLPQTDELRDIYGGSSNQFGCRVVNARSSVLYDVLNNMVIHGVLSTYHVGERELAKQHLPHCGKGDMVIYDRGYPGYSLMAAVVGPHTRTSVNAHALDHPIQLSEEVRVWSLAPVNRHLVPYLSAMRLSALLLLFPLSIAPLSAQTWAPVGSGASSGVYSLEPFNGELYVGGLFTGIGGLSTSYLARWNGTEWNSVASLINFISADNLHANDTALFIGDGGRVRFWNGTNLFNLTGISSSSFNSSVYSMAFVQDTLYVGGFFSSPFAHIAKWNGTAYGPLTSGCDAQVSELASFEGQLFACGNFLTAGDSLVRHTALWNGTAWNRMGAGVNDDVFVQCMFQDTLYIGGRFTQANGLPASRVAKWNGSQWVKVGGTLNEYVTAMTVYRGQLYIGGAFTTPSYIARLNNGTWIPVGTGCNNKVRSLEVYHDSLFVGGEFTMAGGDSAAHIAKWHLPEAPVAAFTIITGTLCPNECTSFTNTSPNGVTSWSWSFPGGTPATSTDSMPTVCYALPGTYPVTLVVTNAGGSDTATDSTAVVVDICAGIGPASVMHDLLLRPNPVQRMLHLGLPGSGSVAVINAQGRVVLTMHNNSKEQTLDTLEWPAGIYVVRFSGEGCASSARFVKE